MEIVMLVLRVGESAYRLDVLPGPASSEYSACAMGENASSASKVTWRRSAGKALRASCGCTGALSAVTTGGVVSTSNRSLIFLACERVGGRMRRAHRKPPPLSGIRRREPARRRSCTPCP